MTIEYERGKAYVVDRGAPRLRAGQGLAAGLGVVIRHFVDAFTKKLDQPGQTSGVFTVQYPEERLPLPEAYRNFPILLYDDDSGHELCTSCFQCQRICPPQVIHMTQAKDPATGKAVPAVAEFVIEYDACMSCGLCAEVCPFDAIKMDHTFELATDQHGGLTLDKQALNRPVSYYERLAPSFWGEARESAYKKLQGNIKRRPDLLGVAPQLAEQIRARRAAEAPPQLPVADLPPTAPATAEDKAARLAAVRAANAAKATPAEQAVNADQPATAEDKAARLAAIRAANAAKATPAEQAVNADQPASAEDKAARLAAIRAANAAKKAAGEQGAGE
ncbi:MAG TPA: NADH-quinone oxidoreductase subunit I [Roseiflexaceae bacterium]|nr:NADH-quinone oxidoreductase subunit I [Roseiflexaceae bacterium]